MIWIRKKKKKIFQNENNEINRKNLHNIVKESVNRIIKETENGGWVVDSSEAQEAYNLAVQEM